MSRHADCVHGRISCGLAREKCATFRFRRFSDAVRSRENSGTRVCRGLLQINGSGIVRNKEGSPALQKVFPRVSSMCPACSCMSAACPCMTLHVFSALARRPAQRHVRPANATFSAPNVPNVPNVPVHHSWQWQCTVLKVGRGIRVARSFNIFRVGGVSSMARSGNHPDTGGESGQKLSGPFR